MYFCLYISIGLKTYLLWSIHFLSLVWLFLCITYTVNDVHLTYIVHHMPVIFHKAQMVAFCFTQCYTTIESKIYLSNCIVTFSKRKKLKEIEKFIRCVSSSSISSIYSINYCRLYGYSWLLDCFVRFYNGFIEIVQKSFRNWQPLPNLELNKVCVRRRKYVFYCSLRLTFIRPLTLSFSFKHLISISIEFLSTSQKITRLATAAIPPWYGIKIRTNASSR